MKGGLVCDIEIQSLIFDEHPRFASTYLLCLQIAANGDDMVVSVVTNVSALNVKSLGSKDNGHSG